MRSRKSVTQTTCFHNSGPYSFVAAKNLSGDINSSKSALDALVNQIVILQSKTNDVSVAAKNCGNAYGDCPPTSDARDQLAAMTSYMTSMVNTFTSLQTQMQTPIDQVNGALNADYTGKAQAGLNTLINMSAIIMDKTTPLRSQIIAKLDDVPKQFEPVLSQIDGYLVPVQEMFANQLAYMRTFTPYINSYGKYGDIAVIVIATFVLLIAIMMLLGCATGAWSFDKAVPPTQRKGAVTCGNFCLIFAVVLILLFAWIFMIVTMVFFVGGTQADASICPVLQGAPNNFTMLDDVRTSAI
ncbi:hypothetical protein RvY_00773-4 [Ramazzottius varieornatus]|uniref:Uncharacterized protein n=1 Tax=Ramazzottius varieornatus TaxID=947166 RepID=A0A1D1UL49_RAMVA|nr:hypothetical protein RvY_00773-4 [Ramazzottius varieornatus]